MTRENRLDCLLFEPANRSLFGLKADMGIVLEHLIANERGVRNVLLKG
jgi:hypothetical protein